MASSGGIDEVVEAFAEAVVFVEPGDLNGLAGIHTQLEEIERWAESASCPRAAFAAQSARRLIERVILNEASEPAAILRSFAELATRFQQVSRVPEDDANLEFPAVLGVPAASPAQTGPTAPPVAPSTPGTRRPFTVKLPSYVDEAMFSEFLARQDSTLEEVETALLRLEQGANEEALGVLTRHLHTLKGETALLGFSDIEQLCHAAEDVLERADLSSAVVDGLLGFKDWLKHTFDAFAGKGAPPVPAREMHAALQLLLQEEGVEFIPPGEVDSGTLMETAEGEGATDGRLTGDPELIADFIVEATEHLDRSDVELLTLETDPRNHTAINSLFRAFHTIKGVCGFIGLSDLQAIAHESENLLDLARKGQIVLEGPFLDIVFDAIDMMKLLLRHIREALELGSPLASEPSLPELTEKVRSLASGNLPTDPVETVPIASDLGGGGVPRLGDILVEMGTVSRDLLEEAIDGQAGANNAIGAFPTQEKLGEVLVKHAGISARVVAQALRTQKQIADNSEAEGTAPPDGRNGDGGASVRETVKVDAARLDQLVDMIGELVIAESMVCQSPRLLKNASTELVRYVSQLDKITRELQEMAMGLRMVPVRSTFQKMARLVRDVAKKTGKEVNFTMQGEETELDKTVVDRISDPLVHMIRNAVDHGLEASGAERRAAGKPTAGNVNLRALHSGGSILIEITDDGKGLDREAILAKARERGLVADGGESLSNKEVWQLIFEPGFSTAKQLTEISGRGVGMDVVKRNIDELRGEIDIQSEKGRGSRFTIRLPLTLAIIDGMLIQAGGERYVIPTLSIIVSVRPRPEDLGTVLECAETMNLQGETIPLFRLYELFSLSGAVTDPTAGTVVVIENAGRRVGILVDRILGQQQIVIKSLGESLRGTRGVAGGAILPDGRVGLIIDVAELVRLATDTVPA